MHNKKCKRALAVVLAGTMALGMGVTAFAADPAGTGSTTGAGEFEGHVDKDVLQVQLPTVPAQDTTFAYTLDPEGLIKATEGAKDKEAKFLSETGVYFLSGTKTYTADSAKLKVINKGTVDADVTVKAETSGGSGVTMASSDTFSDKSASLYLGLMVANQSTAAVEASGGATVTVGLKGSPDNYEVKYDGTASENYTYAAKTGLADTAWNSFEFGLTGACNQNGDFSADGLAAPTVSVTWQYDERESDSSAALLEANATLGAAPSISGLTLNGNAYETDFTKGTAKDLTVEFGGQGATAISTVEMGNALDTVAVNANMVTHDGNKVKLLANAWSSAAAGATKYVVVTLDDGTKLNIKVTIK